MTIQEKKKHQLAKPKKKERGRGENRDKKNTLAGEA
jgi:hypothetical protein